MSRVNPKRCYNRYIKPIYETITMSKLRHYLFSTKALQTDLTDYFSTLYGLPIEIRTRKSRKFSKELTIDKMVFYIPDSGEYINPVDEYDKLNRETLDKWVKDTVEKIGSEYKRELPQEITSIGDLKSLTDEWAGKIGVPTPKVLSSKDETRWGFFTIKNDGNGYIYYSHLLRYIPLDLCEEVVVHELCHAKEWYDIWEQYGNRQGSQVWNRSEGHGKTFWDLMDRYYPNHSQKKDELEKAGVALYGREIESE